MKKLFASVALWVVFCLEEFVLGMWGWPGNCTSGPNNVEVRWGVAREMERLLWNAHESGWAYKYGCVPPIYPDDWYELWGYKADTEAFQDRWRAYLDSMSMRPWYNSEGERCSIAQALHEFHLRHEGYSNEEALVMMGCPHIDEWEIAMIDMAEAMAGM